MRRRLTIKNTIALLFVVIFATVEASYLRCVADEQAPNCVGGATRFTENEIVSIFELEVLGKTHPEDDLTRRLLRIERSLFAKDYEGISHEFAFRARNIQLIAPPSEDLVSFVRHQIELNPNWLSKPRSAVWVSSLVQKTSLMELVMYRSVSKSENITSRITRLEGDVLGAPQSNENQDLLIRTNTLIQVLAPPPALIDEVIQASDHRFDWFSKPPPIKWLKFGSQARSKVAKASSDTAGGIRKVLSSPTFWTIVATGAAIYGMVELARRGWLPVGYTTQSYEHGCTGRTDCAVCTNCRYCRYCNETGGGCGVCY